MGIFQNALTKSALKKALKKNHITVNGVIATSATYITGGEQIQFSASDDLSEKRKLIFPLTVIYEDEYLALIHKPAGILVSGNKFKTIAHALEQNLKKSNLPDASAPQPIHRLDYPTTGILLIGKTSSSIRILNRMFEDREVDKIYMAITIGEMASEGIISSEVDGKNADSEYSVLNSVSSPRFGQLNLVKLRPKSGRRHQLRKHLAGIGNPILGDKEYGKKDFILNGKGLYLHAFSIRFNHPFTKKEVYSIDEIPKGFKKIFADIDIDKLLA